MGRKPLGLGEHSEIDAVPQRRDAEGLWKRCQVRSAERWRARAYVRCYDGIRREVTRFGKTKIAAVRAAEDALREMHSQGDGTMTTTTPLIRAGRLWLAQIGRRDSGLAATTVRLYGEIFNRHIDAEGSSLRGLTLTQANDPQRLRGFLQQVADGSGTGSARTAKTILSNILNLAVDNGTLTGNAMRQVRSVKSETVRIEVRDHRRALTRAQRDSLVAYADALAVGDPRTVRKWLGVGDMLALMAGTGVRIGEASSVRWEHLDLETGRLRLHGTKSAAARRALNLPEWLTERLTARAARTGTEGLMFSSPTFLDRPETMWERRNLDRAVRKVLDETGHEWAISHTLRRTVASLMHQSGKASLIEIADQLGHEDPAVTLVYLGRDFQGDHSAAAALL